MSHPNYGSQAGIQALFGVGELTLQSNPEVDASTVNATLVAGALNYSDAVIDAFFSATFTIPLQDTSGSPPYLVSDWANTIAWRKLMERQMPTMSVDRKSRFKGDPLDRVWCEMSKVKANTLSIGLLRSTGQRGPQIRHGCSGVGFGGAFGGGLSGGGWW